MVSACSSGDEDAAEDADAATSEGAAPSDGDTDGEAAGTDAGDDEPGSAQGDESPLEDPQFEPSIQGEELVARLSALPGRLAIGNGPELAVARPDGQTVDVVDGSESVLASQPTWSRDGTQLAWSSVSAERQVVLVETYDDEGVRTGEPERSNVEGQPVFYLQWSADDDQLAYIRNAEGGGVVEVGLIEPGLPGEPVGEGAPFFISWSPTPDRILAHVNEVSIDAFALDTPAELFNAVTAVDGGFSAPAWVDDQRALIVAEGALSYLNVATGDIEPIVPVAGPIRFVLSPDRTKVAYQVVGGSAGVSVIGLPVQGDRAGLTVLDLETGAQTVVTSELAVAFEWSPDSDKLAWLGAAITDGRPLGRWGFWSLTGDVVSTQTSGFELTRKYGRNYLPFFAQYAQSVTGWSPDSSAFAFAGRVDRQTGIWIQLIDEMVTSQRVALGDVVTWGAGQAPPPTSGGASAA
jgi:TolB protein